MLRQVLCIYRGIISKGGKLRPLQTQGLGARCDRWQNISGLASRAPRAALSPGRSSQGPAGGKPHLSAVSELGWKQPLLGGIRTPSGTESQKVLHKDFTFQLFQQISSSGHAGRCCEFHRGGFGHPGATREGTCWWLPRFHLPAPLPPCLRISPQLEGCVPTDFISGVFLQSWLLRLLVGLLVLLAPSPSEHLPFSNTSTNLGSLQIELLQPPVGASDLLPLPGAQQVLFGNCRRPKNEGINKPDD